MLSGMVNAAQALLGSHIAMRNQPMFSELIQEQPVNLETNRDNPDFYNSDWSDSKDDLDAEDYEEMLEPEGMDDDSDEPFDTEGELSDDDDEANSL